MNLHSTILALTVAAFAIPVQADGRTVARVFWQDDSEATVYYGDLKKSSNGWAIERQSIAGFPKIDPDQQALVQMEMDDGLFVVGVRDSVEGAFGSGWIAVESGVAEELHGDHSHWHYEHPPEVSHSVIDTEQGNPAHVYRYGHQFALANDKKNGFTLTSAKRIRDAKASSDAATFHGGGNGHITLAVDSGSVAYATWIAPEGDDKGRVDVIGLGRNLGKGYSFRCPSGTLHGATMNAGKTFFAPLDGICWVQTDRELNGTPEKVVVHHLSLGEDGDDKPLRTGAFCNVDRHVVFTAGQGDASRLCWVDASVDQPKVMSLPINVEEGESLSTPKTIRSRYGDTFAVLFGQDRESPSEDRVLIVNLDPDRDGRFSDAALVGAMGVGPNQIVGHSGYHAAALLPDRRHVLITNPGDGTLWIISLGDLAVVAKLKLGGSPTRLLVNGD